MKRVLYSIILAFICIYTFAQFNPTNCTSWVINPSFESGIDDGWTNSGMKTQTNDESSAAKTGWTYAEKWVEAPNTLPDSYVQQTIKGLPNGTYELSATCHAEVQGTSTAPTGVFLFAGEEVVEVSATKRYKINITIESGEVTIGFKCVNTNANWMTVDHFQLIKTDGGLRTTAATPLNRGLMAINLATSGGTGNLISWRIRENDPEGYSYKLYRGVTAKSQTRKVNNGNPIRGKSNFIDTNGTATSYYRLEVLDTDGNVVDSMKAVKTWGNQTTTIPTTTPTDTRGLNATYTPNDASFCDMDGDGEYEIILKWDPNNSKDAASNGTTSDTYFDCYKMNGKRLWRINQGPNIRSGAHTTPFIAWDLNGDGYGEFIIKTAPGTIDGNGNYVVMGDDDPLQNCLSSRGKPDKGPEYLTVFDGMTGAEISTIKYHTDYATGLNYWGDSNQNRSERYTACLAYLDGKNRNPSAIFNRGYYAGSFVGAYDFDGYTLKERWVSRNTTSGKGLWGEGAHWLTAADLDNDGFHEIQFGSAALDHNGQLLYRTGLGHGDAFHIGDFLTNRPGLEMFMCHESKPYGVDLRDAKTGELILHLTAGGDTGRGLAAHFDSSQQSAQFIHSASGAMYNAEGGTVNADAWAIGSSGAGVNCRIYWDGDLFDEFFDKSIIAHWNPTGKYFNRIQVNGGNYVWGSLINGSKYNPCVMGDILGDWREEIVTYDTNNNYLIINATNYTSNYPVPHLMDDIQYRENVVSQNVGYNQPPHLSYDPAVRFGVIKVELPTGDLDNDIYYIQNASNGKFLLGGSYWGTRAIFGEHGIDFSTSLIANDTYRLDSKIANSGTDHFLTSLKEPFVDGPAGNIIIKALDNGYYSISNDTAYLEVTADNHTMYSATTADAPSAQWLFHTYTDMINNLNKASKENPIDATFLIQDPNFGRNDQRYSSWVWSTDCTNKDNNGDPTNFCVESWHSTFTFSQTLSGMPNGWYKLSAQGFYRADGSDDNHPVLFANDSEVTLPNVLSEGKTSVSDGFSTLNNGVYIPNSMTEASAAFSSDHYYTDEILFQVTGSTATIGIRNTSNVTDWCIWDNMELSYYGLENPSDGDNINETLQTRPERNVIYTIHGIRVKEITKPGIYIINNKKVIKK